MRDIATDYQSAFSAASPLPSTEGYTKTFVGGAAQHAHARTTDGSTRAARDPSSRRNLDATAGEGAGGERTLLRKRADRGCTGPSHRAPLSCAQERIWVLDQLESASGVYHQSVTFRIR